MKSLDYDGSKCPNCGSDDINGDRIEPEDNMAYRNCDCNDCGAKWTEILKIIGYDNLILGSIP